MPATLFPMLTTLPSEAFRQNVHLTFIEEANVVRQGRETLGVENLMWSSDYPHPVSSWPNSHETVDRMFAGADDHDRKLIVSGNAERVWNL